METKLIKQLRFIHRTYGMKWFTIRSLRKMISYDPGAEELFEEEIDSPRAFKNYVDKLVRNHFLEVEGVHFSISRNSLELIDEGKDTDFRVDTKECLKFLVNHFGEDNFTYQKLSSKLRWIRIQPFGALTSDKDRFKEYLKALYKDGYLKMSMGYFALTDKAYLLATGKIRPSSGGLKEYTKGELVDLVMNTIYESAGLRQFTTKKFKREVLAKLHKLEGFDSNWENKILEEEPEMEFDGELIIPDSRHIGAWLVCHEYLLPKRGNKYQINEEMWDPKKRGKK